jgi:2-methylcitrate dehydratase PrpD
MHPALDALIELVQAHDIQPADVAEVRVKLGPDAALPLVYDRPRNGLEAKFSVPFSAAAAIVFRAAGLQQYTDEQARNPLLSSVMKRVRLERVPGLRSIGTLGAQAEVDLVVRDGRRYRSKATLARGHPKRRLSRTELTDKFHQCAAGQVPAPSARRFVAEIWRIENVSSISRLIKLLRPPA